MGVILTMRQRYKLKWRGRVGNRERCQERERSNLNRKTEGREEENFGYIFLRAQ